jgi:hypothetical protein
VVGRHGRACVDTRLGDRSRLDLLGDRRRGVQGGVDGDRDPDLPREPLGERVLELPPEPALELGPREVVGDGDDRGALVQRHRLAVTQPGLLVWLQVVHHTSPRLLE